MPLLTGCAAGILYLAAALKSPMLGVAAVIGVICGVLVLSYPVIGMALVTFLIPLERLQRFTSDTASFTISVMRIIAMLWFGAMIVHRIVQKRSLRLDPTMFLYAAYVLLGTASLFYTSDPASAKRAVGTILANCLFFLLFFNYFERPSQIRLALAIWLAATIFGCLYSTYDWHFGSGKSGGVTAEVDPGEGAQSLENRWSTVWQDQAEWDTLGGLSVRRSMGPTSHAAVYGINMIMTIPFFFYFLRRTRSWWKQALLYLGLGLVAYNVLLTNTRAVILMAAGTVVLCLLYRLFTPKTSHLLVALVACVLLVPFLPQDVFNRVLDAKNYSSERSAAMRVRFGYWKAGLRVFSEHPILGAGLGNSKEIPKYTGELSASQTTVHNIFLQIALESGAVGWLAFFSFVGIMFYYARRAAVWMRSRRDWNDEFWILQAVQVAMVSVLIFGLQVDVFGFPLKGWWLIATIALVLHHWARRIAQDELQAARVETMSAWN